MPAAPYMPQYIDSYNRIAFSRHGISGSPGKWGLKGIGGLNVLYWDRGRPHSERRVDEHRTAGAFLKGFDKPVVTGVRRLVDGLHAQLQLTRSATPRRIAADVTISVS